MTITPGYLSNSVSGTAISIAGVSINAATLIHKAVNVAGSVDNIHLTLSNTGNTQQTVILEWGATGAQQAFTVSPSGSTTVPFAFLSGGLSLSAFAQNANFCFATGRVYTEGP